MAGQTKDQENTTEGGHDASQEQVAETTDRSGRAWSGLPEGQGDPQVDVAAIDARLRQLEGERTARARRQETVGDPFGFGWGV